MFAKPWVELDPDHRLDSFDIRIDVTVMIQNILKEYSKSNKTLICTYVFAHNIKEDDHSFYQRYKIYGDYPGVFNELGKS